MVGCFQGVCSEASDVYAFAVVMRRIFGGNELGLDDFLTATQQFNLVQMQVPMLSLDSKSLVLDLC